MVNVLVQKGANSIWEHALHDTSINLKSKPKKPNPKDKIKWEIIIIDVVVFDAVENCFDTDNGWIQLFFTVALYSACCAVSRTVG